MAPRKATHTIPSSKKRKGTGPPTHNSDSDDAPLPTSHTTEALDRRRFMTKTKQSRYAELSSRNIICERRVELAPEDYSEFTAKIQKHKWQILASPEATFNEEIVKEFYANAYPVKQQEAKRISWVRGISVPYDRDSINQYLGEPTQLAEGEMDTYTRLTRRRDFSAREVAQLLCIPGHTYEVGASGNALRILRPAMRTLTQIWTNFLLANIVPKTHVSDINMDRANLVWCIMKGYEVDAATLISDEMHRIVTSTSSSTGASRPLGYPALITGLCKAHGVQIPHHPVRSIRPPINRLYVETHCTNPLEDMHGPAPRPQQARRGAQPPPAPEFSEFQQQMTAHLHHIQEQQAANYRASTMLNDSFYRLTLHQHQHPTELFPWPSPQMFTDYVAWPGDRPFFPGGAGRDGDGEGDARTAEEEAEAADGDEEGAAEAGAEEETLGDEFLS